MEYDESLESCVKELERYVKLNDNVLTYDYIVDSPIYPENKELYNEFVDECGFNEIEFINYLIRRSEILDTIYDDNSGELVITNK